MRYEALLGECSSHQGNLGGFVADPARSWRCERRTAAGLVVQRAAGSIACCLGARSLLSPAHLTCATCFNLPHCRRGQQEEQAAAEQGAQQRAAQQAGRLPPACGSHSVCPSPGRTGSSSGSGGTCWRPLPSLCRRPGGCCFGALGCTGWSDGERGDDSCCSCSSWCIQTSRGRPACSSSSGGSHSHECSCPPSRGQAGGSQASRGERAGR